MNECNTTYVPPYALMGRTEPDPPFKVFMLPLVDCTTPCLNSGAFSYEHYNHRCPSLPVGQKRLIYYHDISQSKIPSMFAITM